MTDLSERTKPKIIRAHILARQKQGEKGGDSHTYTRAANGLKGQSHL